MDNQSHLPIIQSRQNSKVKAIAKLLQRSHREKAGLFLIEGIKELSQAISNNIPIEEILFCPEYFGGEEYRKLLNDSSAKKQQLAPSVFDKISYRENPDGLMASAKSWNNSLDNIKLSPNPLLVIAESLEKPGNLGNLIRTAEAAKADALIVTESVVDPFNPNVIRASRGLLFSLPVVTTDNKTLLPFLKKHNIQTVAATPNTDNIYWDTDFTQPTAILLGTEKGGLSDFWMKNPEIKGIKIPLLGHADSLNVGIAGAITLYEVLRQRR